MKFVAILLVPVLALLLAAAPPPRDPKNEPRTLGDSLVEWAKSGSEASVRETTRRLLLAGGRNADEYQRTMSDLEGRFRAWLAERPTKPVSAEDRGEALRDFMFVAERFRSTNDLADLDHLYPDAILERRTGFCLGLSLVTVELAERVGWPAAIVAVPRHVFVRIGAERKASKKGGRPYVNLETTKRGELVTDDWYRSRFGFPEDTTRLRILSTRTLVAHLVNNHGFALLEAGRFEDAQRELDRALALSAELIEAEINLGVLAARTKDFSRALEHFARAAKAWPSDGGIRLNEIHAHLALGNSAAAVGRLCELSKSSPELPGLDAAVARTVELLDPAHAVDDDWRLLQRLAVAREAANMNRQGKRRGLRGIYYKDAELGEAVLTRVDPDLSFMWRWGSPDRRIPNDRFSARWTGWLEVPHDDLYGFYLTLSDGIRIWIDGKLVVNAWRRANDNFAKGEVWLKKGAHRIEVEYFEQVGESGLEVIFTADASDAVLPLAKYLWCPERSD